MTLLAEQTKSMSKTERTVVFEKLLAKASAAGHEAAEAAVPNPMVVYEANLDGTVKEGGKAWYESEGPCGFAWVVLRPATSSFARYIKRTRFDLEPTFGSVGRSKMEAEGGSWGTSYYGGYQLWVWVGGQSIARKEAFARAYASVLQEAGYQAYAQSRLD